MLLALAAVNRQSLPYVAPVAGAVYLASVVGFAFSVRNAKRVLAGALAGVDGDALEAAVASPGWKRDVIIAAAALATLLLGIVIHH